MGKGKGGGEIEVNEYLMSQHVGICLSADELLGIYVGEKEAWSGSQTAEGDIIISASGLFGGQKKEGGVQGVVRYLPGLPTQVLPDRLAQKLGRASGADCPGFRGITSLFFTGTGPSASFGGGFGGIIGGFGRFISSVGQGFHWVSNNPYLKDLWVKVRRAPKGLNPATARVPRIGGSGLANFTSGAAVSLKWWQSSKVGSSGAEGRMGVRYIGFDGEPITDIIWSSSTATTAGVWTERTLTGSVPAACYAIRYFMEMEQDAYIDDITLSVGGVAVGVSNPGGEFNNDYGWATEVGSLVTRYSSPAPHSGTGYFSGGTYSLSRAHQTITKTATGDDANPSHMIYECLTNQEWGMGAAPTLIDVGSFEQAAVTLLLEGMGLSMIWTRQTTIEAFVSEILDHIQATLFVNPRNGLLTLKLIRGDYNLDDLREVTVDNARMSNFQRKAWGEIISEIVVTWTNPENEQDETVNIHDNAAIASQGVPVSDSRNYYGVRSSALAMKLAARDLRTSSTPLASCDVELNRTAWDILPGEVVKVIWAERGLNGVPMRVGSVDYGRPGEPEIKASLLEDIFGYATTDYSTPPSTGWEDDDMVPVDMLHPKIITVPSFFAANYLPATGGLADIAYPEVVAGVLATSENAVAYDVYGDKVQVDGSITQDVLTTNTVAGYATLTSPLAEEAQSVFVGFTNFQGRVAPAQNVFVFIGGSTVGDEDTEVALISENTSGSYTLKRGILDTSPKIWDAGTPCYFIEFGSTISDKVIRSDAEGVTLKLLSRTVGGVLSIDDATDVTGTLSGRPHYPLRPANVKVADQAFGVVDISAIDPIAVTWSNRNRTMENSQVVFWDEANVTPETGQTTTVGLYTEAGVLITEYTGVTGTSQSVPKSALGSNTRAVVKVKSVRDSFASLQAHSITVDTTSGSGTGGGSGGGGGSGAFPASASWSSFIDINSTTYSALTTTIQTISALSGDTITATADLAYDTNNNTYRLMRAKWQYRIAGTTTWYDMGVPVEGTVSNGVVAIPGEILVTQSIAGVPANDYQIQLVAIVSAGGATLSTTGTASVVAT